ncbi:FUSC family protein [Coraliomargarita parva]|uniref:FUSC family protein n=1 Tax=Coraliomargarita parva TaxID=3014050 RepID=UPI0022B413E3|nr:FUSC family protein [Coraliomargarita parva]
MPALLTSISHLARETLRELFTLSDRKRPPGLLIMATIAMGLPVLIGSACGAFATSSMGCMGGMVILYLRPRTSFAVRLRSLLLASSGFILSFTLGLVSNYDPLVSTLTLAATAFMAALICRSNAVLPPASFFFVLVACVARAIPFDPALILTRAAVLSAGCFGALCLGLVFSILRPATAAELSDAPVTDKPQFLDALVESATIAAFVAGGYHFARLIHLDNPYWVPISTIAILQGTSLRAVWHRKVHRILGTAIGMGLAWLIFRSAPGPWTLSVTIMILGFLIESLVTRNYALAVIFITPLTVIYADAHSAYNQTEHLILMRFVDSMLGSVIGYLGGLTLYLIRPAFVRKA